MITRTLLYKINNGHNYQINRRMYTFHNNINIFPIHFWEDRTLLKTNISLALQRIFTLCRIINELLKATLADFSTELLNLTHKTQIYGLPQ